MRKQGTDWEKTFANHISDKDSYLEYKKSQVYVFKKVPIRKLAKVMKKHFSEKNIHMPDKNMKSLQHP